jgi:integrase
MAQAMIDKNKLLKKYAENLDKSDNKNHYLSYARHFLDNAEGLDRISIDHYIEGLKERYKPGSVNFVFRVIRRLFAVNNLPWEYRRSEAPRIGQGDEYYPQLSTDIIRMMILAAKNGRLYTDEQCFIALSTIYGLRRQELANVQPKDISLETNALYIATVKSGRERYHLIPSEIRPYLKAHDFNKRYAIATLSQMFKRILIKSGARKLTANPIGWHSIRRALLVGLADSGVNILAIRTFLRWKAATRDLAMPARYYGSVVVGLGRTEPMRETIKGDEVFAKHPFLGFWKA